MNRSVVFPPRPRSNPARCAPAVLLMAAAGCALPGGEPAAQALPEPPALRAPEVMSLLGTPLYAMPPGARRSEFESRLAEARQALERAPDDPERIIWVGRRLGYLWRIDEALAVYTAGLQRFPELPELYRHRGHRLITARRFDDARMDLERAAELIRGRPDRVEPDGLPNAENIPLTSTAFNVWYHLALSRYLLGDFDGAAAGFAKTLEFSRGYDDNRVAATDWMYMSLRRAGRHDEAAALLRTISPDMHIIENHAYHRRLMMYQGRETPEALLGRDDEPLNLATMGYGVGNWYLCEGRIDEARAVFERVVAGPTWPAFGYIAAEADLARMKQQASTP